ncbi:ferritin-like domain-containing protein [Accumulibacter sp.]|uniref:ferritin-like domain-containing protein n=1 Tax=Accumulibacter sp. TaxID=2053492 RepID=UPI00287A1401|nr:ferritin-like domain-containing protein [Accumulibacter sp.]MDS4054430.1 ferritin-like domain-containing protein [Accumulibacter sp.]HMX69217.1 ferritin-like domain-containing protein [Accumulibacter sp.]
MTRPTLESVCRRMARRRSTDLSADPADDRRDTWNAAFFRLPYTRYWHSAKQVERDALLARCTANVLGEALGVEAQAMDYSAKRVLAADNLIEKQVYSLIAAEEARHHRWLSGLQPTVVESGTPAAFAGLLARLVREASPLAQSYLLQIVLEGWGISHYRRLAAASLDAGATRLFAAIAQDEGLHYAAGIAHFDASRLTGAERAFIRIALAELCTLLACGPLAVLHEVERSAGGFAPVERAQAFADLLDRCALRERLDHLARFVAHQGMEADAIWLREQGLLAPLPAATSLHLYSPP